MSRDRFDRKVDHTFDTKADIIERVEVITGVGRRRSWPLNVKVRIVMESLEDGAIISEVARRHGIRPQQLFAWRKQVRDHVPAAGFTPVVVDGAMPVAPPSKGAALAELEITSEK
jgi:transposase